MQRRKFHKKSRSIQRAILNWFDVTAPEGYYSLNSKIEDIVKSEEGATVFKEVMVSAMGSMMGGNSEKFDMAPMMKMLGSFTVLRLTSLLGATNVNLTKEQLLDMNEKLNAIPVVE